jgi:uncharacterized protein
MAANAQYMRDGSMLTAKIRGKLLSANEKSSLKELKGSLKGVMGIQPKLVLFGSRARGDFAEDSDLDLAIIVPGLTPELKKEILDKTAEIELKYLTPLSTLVISEEDFNALKKRERRIALDIEREGIPL